MIKKAILLITILSLSSCIAVRAKIDDFKYAPKYGKEGFPTNGKAIVSLDLFVRNQYGKDIKITSYWKKINENGSYGDGIYLTNVATSFKREVASKMLEPGYYFLDSFSFQDSNYLIRSGSFGWDAESNKPYFIGFKISKGEEINFAPIRIEYKVLNGSRVIYKFNIEDQSGKEKWIIGERTREF